ncbi:MAG: DNA-processing protein DprA [Desulfobacterales bacterium]|nr:DNA-processing protein DprA [Desulfobacterales bacterium]
MTSSNLSEDAKDILLLCGYFGSSKSNDDDPMSLSEYNRVAAWLSKNKYSPADMVTGRALEALKHEKRPEIDPQRCERLLSRGASMAFALERWMNKGIWVLCRSDSDYPQQLRERLHVLAPAILYGIGEREIFHMTGLAVVGSRNVDQKGAEFAAAISRRAAEDGMTIVSGAARGVDQIAMSAALEEGGKVLGVMADSLLKTSLRSDVRDFIRNRQLLLLSPYYPEAGWSVGNAMGRNKHIYALSKYALVVSADQRKGGTWEGAIEELRRQRHIPVFVRLNGDAPEGNRDLRKKGALPFPDQPFARPLPEILGEAAKIADSYPIGEQSLFTTASQERIPQPPSETTDTIKESIGSYSTESIQKEVPKTVFDAALPLILEALMQPQEIADLSKQLDVQKSQLSIWIKKAIDQKAIKKVKKKEEPIRYLAVRQDALFKKEDIKDE